MARIERDEGAAISIRELGVSEVDIELARQGTATDPRIAAIVAFGQQVIAAPAEVGDEQIAEMVGLLSPQLLTGAFASTPAGVAA